MSNTASAPRSRSWSEAVESLGLGVGTRRHSPTYPRAAERNRASPPSSHAEHPAAQSISRTSTPDAWRHRTPKGHSTIVAPPSCGNSRFEHSRGTRLVLEESAGSSINSSLLSRRLRAVRATIDVDRTRSSVTLHHRSFHAFSRHHPESVRRCQRSRCRLARGMRSRVAFGNGQLDTRHGCRQLL